MIKGVQIKCLETHADDRGFFREIIRDDEKLLSHFGQASITMTYPGVIKAFHWHEKQDDVWYVAGGSAQIVLFDRRPDSPSHGQTDVVYAGQASQLVVLIPRGVAHGYRVLGTEPLLLVYFTSMSYSREQPDEHRLPFNDPTINFDWTTKNR